MAVKRIRAKDRGDALSMFLQWTANLAGGICYRRGTDMDWEIIEDRQHPGDWRVEAIDRNGDGVIYVAIFSGPHARERAEEYAAWKAGAVRAA